MRNREPGQYGVSSTSPGSGQGTSHQAGGGNPGTASGSGGSYGKLPGVSGLLNSEGGVVRNQVSDPIPRLRDQRNNSFKTDAYSSH